MFDKKISTRIIIKNALWAVLAIAIAGTIVFFASKQTANITKSIVEKKQASLLLQKRSEAIGELRTGLAQVGENDAKLAAALPPDDNISQFLSSLDDLARQHSLQETVRISTPAATAMGNDAMAISEIDYSVALNGTAVTLTDYLKGLETLPYFFSIRSISISSPAGWEGNSSISIQAALYAKTTNN